MIIISAALTTGYCRSQELMGAVTGQIHGTVVMTESGGNLTNVPDATVTLNGPRQDKASSDEHGSYHFTGLPSGRYLITATVRGLIGSANVVLNRDVVLPVDILLHVAPTTVTVTAAADPPPAATSAQDVTISSSVVQNAPNATERFENLLPLVPGVVRGPDGQLNMKGASSTQAGWLVNSSNVTDPATGDKAMNLPIDVVSSVKVLSNPYDPEYGRFTGAVSSVQTRTSNFNKFHLSIQNLLPRPRRRGGHFVGIGAATPRLTITGPLVRNKYAFTQSLEYRFVRTPVESLPPLHSDSTVEGADTFSQVDMNIGERQTATVSLALFPQRIEYLGLNTFNTQPSTPSLHQRGYQTALEHRLVTGSGGLVLSQASFQRYDADVLPNSTAPYQMGIETTEGGFFNTQRRRDDRIEWRETYQFGHLRLLGIHDLKFGAELSHSTYDGQQTFLPVVVLGSGNYPVTRIEFGPPAAFAIHQNEIAWYGSDQWKPWPRLSLDVGLRFDHDSITDATNPAPRAGLTFALSRDRKTLLRAGGGLFYDRVPLNAPAFPYFPLRRVEVLNSEGQATTSTSYSNVIRGHLRSPRSDVWNTEIDREIAPNLLVRVAYQQRHTSHELVVATTNWGDVGELALSSSGRELYHEFQIAGTYHSRRANVNASYVQSRAYGDLNDFGGFFSNDPQAVIQPDQRGRLNFDVPHRVLAWGEVAAPWKLTFIPVFDVHTGFPFSTENQEREFVGPRNALRFPLFVSADMQVLRSITLPFTESRKVKIGFGVFNLFDHFNPRDVQNNVDSYRFGALFNSAPTTFRGKFVLEF